MYFNLNEGFRLRFYLKIKICLWVDKIYLRGMIEEVWYYKNSLLFLLHYANNLFINMIYFIVDYILEKHRIENQKHFKCRKDL